MENKQFFEVFLASYKEMTTGLKNNDSKIEEVARITDQAETNLLKKLFSNLDADSSIQQIIKDKNIPALKALIIADDVLPDTIWGRNLKSQGLSESEYHVMLCTECAEIMEKENNMNPGFLIVIANFFTAKKTIGYMTVHTIREYFKDHFDIDSIMLEVAMEKNPFAAIQSMLEDLKRSTEDKE